MNKQEFRKITELLEENFNKKLDLRILEIWYQEFKELPKEQYEAMVVDAIKIEKFMPTLARMRELKKPTWFNVEIKIEEVSKEEQDEIEKFLKGFRND